MPIVYPYTQYGGVWNLTSQSQAQGAGTWPQFKLFAWGSGGSGQLGLGNRTNYSSPKQVASGSIWSTSQVASGNDYDTAAVENGSLWAWGQNESGQLGLGNTTYYSSPKQVGALTNWKYVYLNYPFTMAIKTDGTLWAWGGNSSGQLGLGNITSYSSPKQVGALTNWASLALSNAPFVAATKTDGTLWTWGNNSNGQLGLNNRTNYSSPVQVGALTNWLKVSCGYRFLMAIKTDGTLWGWGDNTNGEVGLPSLINYSSPKQVGALTNWKSVSNGQYFTLALKTDGTLWFWGDNFNGNSGNNVSGNAYSSPTQVGSLTSWSSVTAGPSQSAAIKNDGTLWMWGKNQQGQLGLGNRTSYSIPKQIGTLSGWLSVSCSTYNTAAIAVF